jgi:hypothetical protein
MAEAEKNLKDLKKLEEKKVGSLEKIIDKLEEGNEAERDDAQLTAEQNDESISIQENVLKLAAKNEKDTKTMVAQGKEAAKLDKKKLKNDEKQISLARRAAKAAGLKAKERLADAKEGLVNAGKGVVDGVKAVAMTGFAAVKAAIVAGIVFIFLKSIPALVDFAGLLLDGEFMKAGKMLAKGLIPIVLKIIQTGFLLYAGWKTFFALARFKLFLLTKAAKFVLGQFGISMGKNAAQATAAAAIKPNIFKRIFKAAMVKWGLWRESMMEAPAPLRRSAARAAGRAAGAGAYGFGFGASDEGIDFGLRDAESTQKLLGGRTGRRAMRTARRNTGLLGKTIRLFSRGISALRVGFMAMVTGITTISAPVLAIVAAVVAIGAGLFFLAKYIKKKLNIDSWIDMAKVAGAKIMDIIGTILNLFTGVFRWQLKWIAKGLRKFGFEGTAAKAEALAEGIRVNTNRTELAIAAAQKNTRASRLKDATIANQEAERNGQANNIIVSNSNGGNVITTNNNTSLVGGDEPASRPTSGNPYHEAQNLFGNFASI